MDKTKPSLVQVRANTSSTLILSKSGKDKIGIYGELKVWFKGGLSMGVSGEEGMRV